MTDIPVRQPIEPLSRHGALKGWIADISTTQLAERCVVGLYQLATFIVFNVVEDAAMLSLAFC
jgi:hypothetical protein